MDVTRFTGNRWTESPDHQGPGVESGPCHRGMQSSEPKPETSPKINLLSIILE